MILVADDEPTFARQVAKALQAAGSDVVVCVDATDLVARLNTEVDALVMEPNLRGTTWYSLFQIVREVVPTLPIFVATAYPSRALFRVAREYGVKTACRKPVAPEAIVTLLHGTTSEACNLLEHKMAPTTHLATVEWEHINEVIRLNEGNMSSAARALGIPRQTLYRKLRKVPQASIVVETGGTGSKSRGDEWHPTTLVAQ
jgi:two-component system, response regulator RegA